MFDIIMANNPLPYRRLLWGVALLLLATDTEERAFPRNPEFIADDDLLNQPELEPVYNEGMLVGYSPIQDDSSGVGIEVITSAPVNNSESKTPLLPTPIATVIASETPPPKQAQKVTDDISDSLENGEDPSEPGTGDIIDIIDVEPTTAPIRKPSTKKERTAIPPVVQTTKPNSQKGKTEVSLATDDIIDIVGNGAEPTEPSIDFTDVKHTTTEGQTTAGPTEGRTTAVPTEKQTKVVKITAAPTVKVTTGALTEEETKAAPTEGKKNSCAN